MATPMNRKNLIRDDLSDKSESTADINIYLKLHREIIFAKQYFLFLVYLGKTIAAGFLGEGGWF